MRPAPCAPRSAPQKLPNLTSLTAVGCDARLPQQLAAAPLSRLSRLRLAAQPDVTPRDVRYLLVAQVRSAAAGAGRLGCGPLGP